MSGCMADQSPENDADLDARVAAFNAAYCRPYGPLTERDDLYWDAPIPPDET